MVMAQQSNNTRTGFTGRPHENPALQRRFLIAGGLALLFGLVVLLRLYHLTYLSGDFWLAKAESNFLKPRDISPPRGVILDGDGVPLALNRPVFDIKIRRYGQKRGDIIAAMKTLAEQTDRQLLATPARVLVSSPSWRQIDLIRGLPPQEAAPIMERIGAHSCLEAELRYQRHYPLGRAAAQVVGYLRQIPGEQMESRLEAGYRRDDLVGWTGLESGWEEYLRGQRGRELLTADALNRPKDLELDEQATPGNTVSLTLSARLQNRAYELLEAQDTPGSIAAINPKTGAILALASYPTFDPNTRRFAADDTEWNRALRTATAPGSTIKVLSAVAFLEEGKPDKGSYYCGGYFKFPNYNRKFHCDHRQGCGRLRLESAIQRSCNVYFYRGSNAVGGNYLEAVYRRFGLGAISGFTVEQHLDYEVPGSLHAGGAAYPADVIMAGIGQGQVAATPLQMAVATAAIANGGVVYIPYLVEEVKNAEDERVFRRLPRGRRVRLDSPHQKQIVSGMRAVVQQSGGTAFKAQFPRSWDAAGKTGSAERADVTDSWFICFAPASDPQIALAVRIEEGGHGSEAAVPITRDLLTTYFQD
jgi:penicillin-binding protein 2